MRPIRLDSYQGLVFGSVEAGIVTWDKGGTFATFELKLLIKGGTQTMADLRGAAVLLGTVTYDERNTGTFSEQQLDQQPPWFPNTCFNL